MKLRISNISKKFRSNSHYVEALEDINLEVKEGEFVCLVGPSGCGKSTLLSLVAGLERTRRGTIEVVGKVGFMFQDAALFPWLKVRSNVAFGLKQQGMKRSERTPLVQKYLNMVHLSAFADSYPHELSGGMRQRAALARTLILDPDILLMDEPFAALDAQTRELLYNELQEIWHMTKKTVMFVTHNVREAVCLGDRVVVFTARPGRIKKEYRITLPRPRDMNDLEVAKISNEIMKELKEEIDKVVAEMLAYHSSQPA
ncbi:MAG: ABC transporter ATP-binding protein [Candidatus Kerfeldbacteria bacterium]